MRTLSGRVDARPSKAIFRLIIADYDLNRAICELVDNALDIWHRGGESHQLAVAVSLDTTQRTICVTDNAGGVKREELRFVFGPGLTGNRPTDKVIGIFGVGTMRAVVALAQHVRVRSRHASSLTHEVEFDDAWLATDEWDLDLYDTDSIAASTTSIEMDRLRFALTDDLVPQLIEHLSAVYARFLAAGRIGIKVGNDPVKPTCFDSDWAFPPGYPPQEICTSLKTRDGDSVDCRITSGLTQESSPATGEYGVYVYCNDRLIARALKSMEVGFASGLAGKPHPKIASVRTIVEVSGPARAMPWNSSKSGINFSHPVFSAIQKPIIDLVTHYASIARALIGDWPDKVACYTTGTIQEHNFRDAEAIDTRFLPDPPRSRFDYGERLSKLNRKVHLNKPWTRGLTGNMYAVDFIFKRRSLDQKNRVCLILLDSILEIAFKDYLVNEVVQPKTGKLDDILRQRALVEREIQQHLPHLGADMWKKIAYFYKLRCKLIHERADAHVTDDEIEEQRSVVERLLKAMFGLRFGANSL